MYKRIQKMYMLICVHFNIFCKVDGWVQHDEIACSEGGKRFAKRVCGELAIDKQRVRTAWCRAMAKLQNEHKTTHMINELVMACDECEKRNKVFPAQPYSASAIIAYAYR